MRSSSSLSPFARSLDVDSVPDTGLETSIEASAEECAAVAAAIDLPSVAALRASFKIERRQGDRLQVEGVVTARITQICVVSLEPFESDIAAPIDVVFAPSAFDRPERLSKNSRRRPRQEEAREVPVLVRAAEGEEDPPDPIVDGRIDLGGVAVEFLTLALDFYPRKPGVHFHDVAAGESGPSPSAFAALERFKDRS